MTFQIGMKDAQSLQAYDAIVVGAGFAGSVVARRLAEEGASKVCILEAREHIAGNAYDSYDSAGILVHRYGPHIYHTYNERVDAFVRRFTEIAPYQHRVLANVYGTLMPVPFNHASLKLAFGDDRGEELYQKLCARFGENVKVPILELRKSEDADLREVADYVYKNVFAYYTQKQWGKSPDEIDPAITGRVPIFIGDDDRYFPQAPFQGMPKDGYTKLFENMLNHPNIDVYTEVDARDYISVRDGLVLVQERPFAGEVIYTGPLDELFDCDLGALPYRSLDMRFETLSMDRFQPVATVNYTTTEDFTRITEFKNMTGQVLDDVTTIMREYPLNYTRGGKTDPYYPILEPENQELYEQYKSRIEGIKNFHPVGRLPEYRYYDMDAVIASALELSDALLSRAQDGHEGQERA